MSAIAVKIEELSKVYQLQAGRRGSLTETISSGFYNFFKGKKKDAKSDEFWALKEVSFEIRKGEATGIIGKNGAGKSTLLKILSRITEPTSGRVEMDGKISSLLEVGTGFHPELSGRENIFLNGTILGMKRGEIKKKLDEIVSFSGVEKFIDTPVKRYSSGMYVRLAFSVAAHLDPDILILDEVLAVGDAEFQKKCLGKMEDVTGQGRTVVFVSHNMDAVMRLCKNAVLLQEGSVQYAGLTDQVVNHYLKSDFGTTARKRWDDLSKAPGNNIVRLKEVKVHAEDGIVSENFDVTKKIGITMDYEVLESGHVFTHSYSLFNGQGINVLNSHDVVSELRKIPREKGSYSSTMWIPENFLSEGVLIAGAAVIHVAPFSILFHEIDAVAFNVVDHIRGDSARGDYVLGFPGIVRPLLQWNTVKNKV